MYAFQRLSLRDAAPGGRAALRSEERQNHAGQQELAAIRRRGRAALARHGRAGRVPARRGAHRFGETLSVEHASEWLLTALVAVVSAVLSHAFSTIRARAEWRREADLFRQALSGHESDTASTMGEVMTMKREHELRFIGLEKDVGILDERGKLLVTSYELEQRLQPVTIRADELRRRIVAMEDQLFGYNLDGSLMASHVVVRREP